MGLYVFNAATPSIQEILQWSVQYVCYVQLSEAGHHTLRVTYPTQNSLQLQRAALLAARHLKQRVVHPSAASAAPTSSTGRTHACP